MKSIGPELKRATVSGAGLVHGLKVAHVYLIHSFSLQNKPEIVKVE